MGEEMDRQSRVGTRMTRWATLIAVFALLVTASSCTFYDKLQARNHLNHGVSEYSAKRYDSAVESFRKAIELDPELLDAYLYLAAAYRAQFVPLAMNPENLKKGQQAVTAFERVLEMDPTNQTAMANIADLYRNMDEPEQAKEWYRKLMEVQDDDAEALYGIAAINYTQANDKTGRDGENVEELSEEERAEVNRLVDEGIEALRSALELRPNYTQAMEYLNLLYREKAELAEDEEQRREWQREADRLALQALEAKRQQQREAERARREVFTGSQQQEE